MERGPRALQLHLFYESHRDAAWKRLAGGRHDNLGPISLFGLPPDPSAFTPGRGLRESRFVAACIGAGGWLLCALDGTARTPQTSPIVAAGDLSKVNEEGRIRKVVSHQWEGLLSAGTQVSLVL